MKHDLEMFVIAMQPIAHRERALSCPTAVHGSVVPYRRRRLGESI
jgi:hypothetical protein